MVGRLLLAAVFATALASAQDEGFGGGAGGGGGGRGGGMGGMGGGDMGAGGMARMQRQSKLEIFADKLKLNREQRDEFSKALADGMREAGPIRQKIDAERVNLVQAILSGRPASLDAFTSLMSDMAAVEAKVFAKALAGLKPNQQTKAAQTFELLADTFEATPTGRGGRGGQRRGGGGRN